MDEKKQYPTKSDVTTDWPPPPKRSQTIYSDFLQSELNKTRQSGGELNRLDLLKQLCAKYPLPLEMAVNVLDEFCVVHAPELSKESKRGRYILFAILLWATLVTAAIVESDYNVSISLIFLAIIVSVIRMIHRRIWR